MANISRVQALLEYNVVRVVAKLAAETPEQMGVAHQCIRAQTWKKKQNHMDSQTCDRVDTRIQQLE